MTQHACVISLAADCFTAVDKRQPLKAPVHAPTCEGLLHNTRNLASVSRQPSPSASSGPRQPGPSPSSFAGPLDGRVSACLRFADHIKPGSDPCTTRIARVGYAIGILARWALIRIFRISIQPITVWLRPLRKRIRTCGQTRCQPRGGRQQAHGGACHQRLTKTAHKDTLYYGYTSWPRRASMFNYYTLLLWQFDDSFNLFLR
jgi:hypothetical protein